MSVNAKMTELADAIRALTGFAGLMTLDDMIQSVQAASGSGIVNTAEGETIVISDCLARKFHGLNLYGRTIQDGTPTHEVPIELENSGSDGSITVHVDEQILTVLTPTGLPGIPVTSDGNYTDNNGQQWVCDEIDFARGKYIQRVGTKIATNVSYILTNNYAGAETKYGACVCEIPDMKLGDWLPGLCSAFVAGDEKKDGVIRLGANTRSVFVYFDNDHLSDKGKFDLWLSENPMTIQYILETPTEKTLSAEALVDYAALHTNYPSTTIYNDEDVWMAVKYAVDTATTADYIAALQELGVDV